MPTYKRINGNYTIEAPQVIIKGDLTVTGVQAVVQSNDTIISDTIITLNAGETGNGVSLTYAGIEIARGLQPNVSVRWNESIDTWELTADGSTYSNIGIGGPPGSNLSLRDDPNPTLSANLSTNGHFIISNVADNIKFDGNLQLNYTSTIPSLAANSVVIYSTTPSGGTTGLYIINNEVTNEELITKKRAFGYSMIL